jgi:hypothetical protein
MIGDVIVERVVVYLKTLQNQGKLETRDRVRAVGEDICKFADLKRTGHNRFRDLGDFLIENVSERRPTITEPINAVAQLFQDIAAPLENSRFGDLVGYALRFLSLFAGGELNLTKLGINILYDPMVHYQQVRDAWIGVRIPDGR